MSYETTSCLLREYTENTGNERHRKRKMLTTDSCVLSTTGERIIKSEDRSIEIMHIEEQGAKEQCKELGDNIKQTGSQNLRRRRKREGSNKQNLKR